MENKQSILTICIPTYNRAFYLNRCLNSVCNQIVNYDEIELIVANNCSTDNTDEIIEKYAADGNNIKYINRTENIGPENNFADCFNLATGKYFWIIGDDDFLVSNSLDKILTILKQDDYGLVFLKGSISYKDDDDLQNHYLGLKDNLKSVIYNNHIHFFEEYNYWATFITGNIINRSLIFGKINPFEFANTYLIQLGWNIPAAFSSKENIIIIDKTIVCRADNTGGYRLYEVFGKNYNKILDSLIKRGYDKKIKSITNNHLLKCFFPIFIKQRTNSFKKENYFLSLFPIYWNNWLFWDNIFFNIYIKEILKKIKSKN